MDTIKWEMCLQALSIGWLSSGMISFVRIWLMRSFMTILWIALLVGGCCGSKPKSEVPNQGAGGGTGDPCSADSDCTAPAHCIMSQCVPSSHEGMPCSHDVDCMRPLRVHGIEHDPTLFCILGKCLHLSAAGGPCAIDHDCNPPLVCTGGTCHEAGVASVPQPEPKPAPVSTPMPVNSIPEDDLLDSDGSSEPLDPD